jgi:hypothetical protein
VKQAYVLSGLKVLFALGAPVSYNIKHKRHRGFE